MKRINYVGRDLLTGDRIADAIMNYTTALARRSRADRVDIPVLVGDRVTRVEVILGPASQLIAESVADEREEPVDDALIVDLEGRIDRLRDPRPVAMPEDPGFELPDDLLK